MAKALVLRTHAGGYEVVQLLLDLLPDEKWGIDAARAFQTITSDDDLLNKANHAVIRILHKQRFFMYVFPKLVESASSQNDSSMTIQVVTNYSCSIEFSDRIVKYYRQHLKRDPSS